MKLKYSLILLFLTTQILAQWEMPRFFSQSTSAYNSLILKCSNDSLLFIWADKISVKYCIGSSDGTNWSEVNILEEISFRKITAIVTNSGRIVVAYKYPLNEYVMQYSDDNGQSWSEQLRLITDSDYPNYTGRFFKINSELWFVYRNGNSACTIKSTDNGFTWSTKQILFEDINSPNRFHLFQFNNKLVSVFLRGNLKVKESLDNGANWSDTRTISGTVEQIEHFSGIQTSDNKIVIYYSQSPSSAYGSLADIYSVSSTDEGLTWTASKKITNFVGYDSSPELSVSGKDGFATFVSSRGNIYNQPAPWYAKVDESIDSSAHPHIFNVEEITDNNSVIIKAYVEDDRILDSVNVIYEVNDLPFPHSQMYDDGLHDDDLPNDSIFGIRITNLNQFDNFKYYVHAKDDQLNSHRTPDKTIIISNEPIIRYSEINVNNILLPLDNKGVLADVDVASGAGGYYDENVFLFSSGFYLSGYSNGALWSNGVLTASRIEDYQSGVEGSDPEDINNIVYTIRGSDSHFGPSWQEWIDAVSLGANFYDGNNDSIFNPVDLNGNGVWDTNEDRPDLQGDITAWCIYNDGVPEPLRRFSIEPQGIEIKQSIFASDGNGTMFDDIIFLRYTITNNGSFMSKFDSVYFAPASDPNLGNYADDLLGIDTLENSCFVYNDGPDDQYGVNPPAFFIKQLQGPPVFIPGKTFIDNNGNGEYNVGIDTPLDSAIVKKGKYLGSQYIPGAKNIAPKAFTQYMGSHPSHGDPDTYTELRNYMLGGRGKNGSLLNPCTWEFGNGSTLSNCSELNPKFMYSGDPVSNDGWINVESLDQRLLLSSGPFKLKAGEPIELIYAYIVGRGTDHLNSITKAREISQFAQTVYDDNFGDLPTSINDDKNLIANEFQLYQNYPNPFNPTTTIKFTTPPAGQAGSPFNPSPYQGEGNWERLITLKVYDILGREVRTLVNEQKPVGTYEVQFNASKLSSGVYFYQLSAGSFIQTKKLMVVK